MKNSVTICSLFIFLFLVNPVLADDAADIKDVKESFLADAKVEENMGNIDKAKDLKEIAKNIEKNVTESSKAYVIKVEANMGNIDKAKELSGPDNN